MQVTRNLFTSATLKLTAWYLLLLMIVSLLFSAILFSFSNEVLRRGLRAPDDSYIVRGGLWIDSDIGQQIRSQRLKEGQEQLLGNLIAFNISTLALGGIASFLLARRTLRPIREALDAQTRFSSDAAHELRTPLAVMQTEIEVALRDKKATKKDHAEVLESSLDEVHRLRTLTDRLLLLASNDEITTGPVSLEQIVIDAVTRAVPLAQAKDISIDNQVKDTQVIANDEALADVMTILIDNAIKYSPKKSTVVISSKTSERSATLSVKDQGVGIALSDQKHVFDRFYRADTSRTKLSVEGHGLGLSIARRLIALQNGDISVSSNGKKGSVFQIKLRRA